MEEMPAENTNTPLFFTYKHYTIQLMYPGSLLRGPVRSRIDILVDFGMMVNKAKCVLVEDHRGSGFTQSSKVLPRFLMNFLVQPPRSPALTAWNC